MPETPNTADRMLAILVLVATLATVGVNALAALGLVNGVSPAMISERHPSFITPAGYAFSIWGLIYLWMLAFGIYQLAPANIKRFKNIRTLYIASCALNCAWIWFWHHEQIAVCLLLIAGLTATLLGIVWRLREPVPLVDALLSKAPFGIYFGWVTCAMLVNLNILFSGSGTSDKVLYLLAVVSILLAAASGALACWKLNNYLYPLAVAWALTAIAVKQSGQTALVVAAAFGTVLCLVAAGSVVTRLKDSTSE